MFNRVRDLPIVRNPDFRADWRRHYESRLVDAETAVAGIKSGDHVAFCRGREPQALGLALAARRNELQNVRVTLPQPGRDFGWYDDATWVDSFQVEVGITTGLSREILGHQQVF